MINYFAGKIDNNKTLISVTSYSNYKINNAVSDSFNQKEWSSIYCDWYNKPVSMQGKPCIDMLLIQVSYTIYILFAQI